MNQIKELAGQSHLMIEARVRARQWVHEGCPMETHK